MRRRFDGRHPPERVLETLEELLDLEIIHNGQPRPANHPPVAIANYPISTLVLNVNTGCNLSCTYCYKEDLTTPDRGQRMAFETAANRSSCCSPRRRSASGSTSCSSAASRCPTCR